LIPAAIVAATVEFHIAMNQHKRPPLGDFFEAYHDLRDLT